MVSFENMGLKDNLLRGIYAHGWETPSRIQQQGIPAILTQRDVILQAQSGLGKTGTFAIAMLQRVDPEVSAIQGIIILNTRELADQVHQTISDLGQYFDFNYVKCVGKTLVDTHGCGNCPTILIGTPGKICSVLERRMIHQPMEVKLLVIDEFDKTLEVDFIPTIQEIYAHIQANTQLVLSSATVNEGVLTSIRKMVTDPIMISVKEEELSLEGISQYRINCERDDWKFETILDLFSSLTVAQSIIFVNSIARCERLERMFRDKDFTIRSIHGRMEQTERDMIMKEFRQGKIRILLSTDLTARGIDVPSVSLVINYDLPNEKSQYIHRVGRTGRYGKKGYAINLIGHRYDVEQLRVIEECYHVTIPELPTNFKNFMK